MPDQTDEEIVVAVQQGHKESFGLLIERYEQKMLRYAKKFLFDREDCRDIVQEIFIKAYTNIQSFDPERRFSPWLYRIAHNEFINALKKKNRIKLFPLDLDTFLPHLIAPERTDTLAHAGEIKKMLDRCLDKISSKYREPLILFYYEELDYQEIAEVLKLPVPTVGVRLRRGRLALENLIKKYDPTYQQS